MKKQYAVKALLASLAAGSGILLSGCNGGGATAGGGQTTTAAPMVASQAAKSLFSTNSCLTATAAFPASSSLWWYSGATIIVNNTCNTAQDLSSTSFSFTSQDSNGVADSAGTFTNWWYNGDSYAITFTGSGALQTGSITTGSKTTPKILPSSSITFAGGGWSLSNATYNSTLAASSFTINGGGVTPPVNQYGTLNVAIDTVNTDCKGTTTCSGKVIATVTNSSNVQVGNPIVVPDASLGGTLTQPITNLAPGTYTISGSGITNTTITYNPTNAKGVVTANQTTTVTVKYDKTAPVATYGTATISLAKVVPNYTGNVQVKVLDTKNSNTVVGSFPLAQGGSVTTDSLPVSDSTHAYSVQLTTGIADPVTGTYYVESSNSALTIVKGSNTFTIPMVKSAMANNNVTVAISGLVGSDTAATSFSDANGKYVYANPTSKTNVSTVYKIESGLNLGVSVLASGSNTYTVNPITNTGIVTAAKTINAAFAKQTNPTYAGTYDFAMPTSSGNGIDYSGSFKISFTPNSNTDVSTLSFVSNVPNLDTLLQSYGNFWGWNVTPKWTKTSDVTTGGTKYTLSFVDGSGNATTASLTSSAQLNFAWSLKMSGETFDTVVPIISSVVINGSQAYGIAGGCSGSACVDPGQGKQITGYQEQWSIYDAHKYYPENIPFANLNTINYAFVDFATPKTYPYAGNGSYGIVSADDAADYRQLVALWKEKQRRPYLKVVLSFGGWTNDAETTSPDINFEQMTDAQQQAFAKQAAQLVKVMGFDGVDIDWEWWANHRTTSQAGCSSSVAAPAPYCKGTVINHSTQKYINLLTYLRKELGKDKLLTIATVSSKDKILSDEDTSVGGVVGAWKSIAAQVDYINIMAYDMHGGFDQPNATASQAPWDIDPVNDPYYGKPGGVTIKSSLQAYINAGVPVSKLVLGMPAYGRSSTIASAGSKGGLYQAITGTPKGEFDATGIYSYNCLLKGICHDSKTPAITFYQSGSTLFNSYGGYALTPWAASSNTFITFDDQNSVKAKLNAACTTFGSLGGGMIWALDGDTTDSTSIVTAVKNNIQCK
ncbi:MAG: hypothetical protein KA049_02700 [Burkholderiales bacterium]|nr:hypothetical protein [Burkholderiales bacterium]MBP9769361.1 hypothetical protein [Burkholderiales bacterium]